MKENRICATKGGQEERELEAERTIQSDKEMVPTWRSRSPRSSGECRGATGSGGDEEEKGERKREGERDREQRHSPAETPWLAKQRFSQGTWSALLTFTH